MSKPIGSPRRGPRWVGYCIREFDEAPSPPAPRHYRVTLALVVARNYVRHQVGNSPIAHQRACRISGKASPFLFRWQLIRAAISVNGRWNGTATLLCLRRPLDARLPCRFGHIVAPPSCWRVFEALNCRRAVSGEAIGQEGILRKRYWIPCRWVSGSANGSNQGRTHAASSRRSLNGLFPTMAISARTSISGHNSRWNDRKGRNRGDRHLHLCQAALGGAID